jgi:2-C-methyl-D-erythritol 2,4-cyclodiphosphate synthase
VVCEQPKIAPHRETMQHNLALVLGAPASVKGRRAERLGSIGRSEGIMCLAVALLTS